MSQYYTSERNVQIVIALLKSYNIKRVIASPGSTNVTFVASIQQDSFFEIYSCVDERSAAYMACGMVAETKEPVVLSCTGATASRNYYPALTEAYYRQLPIVVLTSTQDISNLGNMICQVIDRTQQPKDTVRCSVHLQNIKDPIDEKDCELKVNKALLELNHHGSGPVHINLSTVYSVDYSVDKIPAVRKINRIESGDQFPEIPLDKKIAIYAGSHFAWDESVVILIDTFCQKYNAVVFADLTSNYNGRYAVHYLLPTEQRMSDDNRNVDLIIHIGDMSDFAGTIGTKRCWRVSEDGKLADRYGCLTDVFEMSEKIFFEHYVDLAKDKRDRDSFLMSCQETLLRIRSNALDLPFSQLWIAQQMSIKFPKNSCVHLGILSPLRSWSYWPFDPSIRIYSNEGGFGIDGNMSTLIGASLIDPDKLYFCVVGDLSFFYDLNSLGNRHIGKNVRILLVNNSLGAEFKLSKQVNCVVVDDIDSYISAGGHFGRQSPDLVCHYASDLGFEYMAASSKEEFMLVYEHFVSSESFDKPIIFEVFTKVKDEDDSLLKMWNIEKSEQTSFFQNIKNEVKNSIGGARIDALKTLIKGKKKDF